MDAALLLARLVLAAVFLVAGVAKLFDRKGGEEALKGFGLPQVVATPGSIALPLVEIAIAIFLIPTSTAWYASIAALALLLVFCIGIAYNMAKGNHPDCHCFGQLHSEPAGARTLIRNLILATIAGFVVVYGSDLFSFSNGDAGSSVTGWFQDLTDWEKTLSVLSMIMIASIVGLAWVVYHLLGQNGRVLLRLDGLEQGAPGALAAAIGDGPSVGLAVGSAAPGFKLEGLHGETMTLDALRSGGKPVMLMFMDPKCGPCNALLPDISRWSKDHAPRLTLAFLTRGAVEANLAKTGEFGLSHVLLQNDREVSEMYKASATPSAVIVQPDGTIGSPVAVGADAIRQLVSRATNTLELQPAPQAPAPAAPAPAPAAQPQRKAGLDIGSLAPAISLPDLAGKTVELKDFKGDPAMVVFWNPGCGFCKRMTDDIKAWEANPPKGAPKMLIVSTGTPESNTELGLKTTTVLDQNFQTGRAFGASGTPSAVLIDADGKISSEVAVGSPAVMALANNQAT